MRLTSTANQVFVEGVHVFVRRNYAVYFAAADGELSERAGKTLTVRSQREQSLPVVVEAHFRNMILAEKQRGNAGRFVLIR